MKATIAERLIVNGGTTNLDCLSDHLWAMQQNLGRKNFQNTRENELLNELDGLLREAKKVSIENGASDYD